MPDTTPASIFQQPARRRAAAIGAAAALLAAFCVSPEYRVEVQPAGPLRPLPRMGPFNPEEGLSRGDFPEVESYYRQMPRQELEGSPRDLAFYGKALLASGDLDAALPLLARSIELESRSVRRGELEWALAQAFIFWNQPAVALEYADSARRGGYGLLPGFLNFLAAISELDLYAGPRPGETHEAQFSMSGFDLIRLPVRINGSDSAAILDTGAAYTILTQSFAREVGVREIPDSKAFGRGLHAKEFPLTFGIADRLEFAGFSVENVPVMLMPDDALLFETSRGEFPVPMVLGLHLIKEFTLDLDYGARRLAMTRTDFRAGGRGSDQNLFLVRGRLFARSTLNRAGWYQLLLDTGSEPTMLTSSGIQRAGIRGSNRLYPKKLYGIGKSQAAWMRVDAVTIGVAGFGVRYRNLVVREDDDAFEDGILGNSFLRNFRVRIDFQRMRMTLQTP